MSVMYIVLFPLFYVILPLLFTKAVYNYQKKCKNNKIYVFIDSFCFFVFIFWGFVPLCIRALSGSGYSSDSTMRAMMIYYIRGIVGYFCAIPYSIFVNFRQVNKYLEKIKVDKANFFNLVTLFEICFILCFIRLCQIDYLW